MLGVIYTNMQSNDQSTQTPSADYRDAVIVSNLRLSDRCTELEKELHKREGEIAHITSQQYSGCWEMAQLQEINERLRERLKVAGGPDAVMDELMELKELVATMKRNNAKLAQDMIAVDTENRRLTNELLVEKLAGCGQGQKLAEETAAKKVLGVVDKVMLNGKCVYDKDEYGVEVVYDKDTPQESKVKRVVKKRVLKPVVKKEPDETKEEISAVGVAKSPGEECGKCDKSGWWGMKNTELVEECTRLGIKGVKKLPKKGIVERLLAHHNGGAGDGKGNVVGL